jgi:hypothetical protein
VAALPVVALNRNGVPCGAAAEVAGTSEAVKGGASVRGPDATPAESATVTAAKACPSIGYDSHTPWRTPRVG